MAHLRDSWSERTSVCYQLCLTRNTKSKDRKIESCADGREYSPTHTYLAICAGMNMRTFDWPNHQTDNRHHWFGKPHCHRCPSPIKQTHKTQFYKYIYILLLFTSDIGSRLSVLLSIFAYQNDNKPPPKWQQTETKKFPRGYRSVCLARNVCLALCACRF